MGLWSGIKKLGRGIGKGVKKGVKAFDKFDDWIKLKELAQIGQFIPGVNVFAKPISMAYSGFDVAKGIKNKDIMGAALSAAQMYGSHKIKTSGFGGAGEALGVGQTGAEALGSGIVPSVGFKGQAIQNLKDWGGGASNPFGLMDKYAGLDKGSKFAIDALAPPILGSLQRSQGQSQGPSAAPYQSYQPIDYGNIAGFSPTTQLPTQARGGITGDDWHQPINRLPANYEGWVTQPSLATLGEAGKEAVLPLNKLLPAMNKGGLNYSPGQAIVGEAGPEYVTRLGPGEEQYAQRILQERPMPQMQEGSVVGGRPGAFKKRALGALSFLAGGIPLGLAEGAGFNPLNLLMGKGNWFGEDIGGEHGSGALFGPGTQYPSQQDYLNSTDYELDELGGRRVQAQSDEDPEAYRMANEAYQERARQIEAEKRNTIGQMSAQQGGQEVQISPGMSEADLVGRMMRGEELPKKVGEYDAPPVSPIEQEAQDPLASIAALLDNPNAREWQRRAKTSKEDKERYEGMLQELMEQQAAGVEFPEPESPFEVPIEASNTAGDQAEALNQLLRPLTNEQHWSNTDPARWRDMVSQSISPVNDMMQPPSPEPAGLDPSMFGGIPQDPEAERIRQGFAQADAGAFQNPRLYPELYPEEYQRSVAQDQENAGLLQQLLRPASMNGMTPAMNGMTPAMHQMMMGLRPSGTNPIVEPGPPSQLTREQQLQLSRLYRE